MMKKNIIAASILFLLAPNLTADANVATVANDTIPISDNTSKTGSEIVVKSKKSFEDWIEAYRPIDLDFWEESIQAILENKYEYAFELAENQIRKTEKKLTARTEAQWVLAQALDGMGFRFAAIDVLMTMIQKDIYPEITDLSVFSLEKIFKLQSSDSRLEWLQLEDFEEIYAENLFRIDPKHRSTELQAFLFYFDWLHVNKTKNHLWSIDFLMQIEKDNYWYQRYLYKNYVMNSLYLQAMPIANSATAFESTKVLDSTLLRLSESVEDPALAAKIKKTQAIRSLQRGNLELARNQLAVLPFNPIDSGEVLLARAQVEYELKNYSKALGLLYVLEAPIFNNWIGPEYYLLQLKIYNELCYYQSALDAIKAVRLKVTDRFLSKKIIDFIKNPMIQENIFGLYSSLTLQKWNETFSSLPTYAMQSWHRYYFQLNDENKKWKDKFSSSSAFHDPFRQFYDRKKAEVEKRLKQSWYPKRSELRRLIIAWKQRFSDFEKEISSKSKKMKSEMNSDAKPTAKSTAELTNTPTTKFTDNTALNTKDSLNKDELQDVEVRSLQGIKKAFWPFNGDLWLDELENIKVDVRPQCE